MEMENEANREGDDACAICLEELQLEGEDTTSLPCLHSFHSECLNQWLEKKNDANGNQLHSFICFSDLQ
jgi:hypothetical protein